MAIITKIEALDLISQLGQETVIEYTAESKTVETIVDDLLALQILSPAITKGTISNSIKSLTRSIQVDGDSILRALYRLRDTVGGYIEVTNARELNWLDSMGENKGQQIRYRKNLKGIEREIDYSHLFNRIYAYGEGEGTARIKLSDAEGQSEDYVEDTDSQTEWGGIYICTITEPSITHPDTLLAFAQLKLAELKDPPIYYRIDTVDLSQSEEFDFSFEELQLGSTVNVVDEDLGIDVDTIVVKIEHPNLIHPERMNLELANRTKDITDVLTGVYDIQQFNQHIATKIGAGQVIVKGTFTVIDWVTEGETTIVGSHIETGTITADKLDVSELSAISADVGTLTAGILQSSNWGASAGSEFNLDDGTFRLGGSSSPALEWNGSELTLEGLFDGEWYNKSGVIIDATKGIRLYGTDMAFGTFANETDARNGANYQTKMGSDGKLYAGAGSLWLDADGLHVGSGLATWYYGETGYGVITTTPTGGFQISSVNGVDLLLQPNSGGDLVLYPIDGDVILRNCDLLPYSDDAYDLGSSSKKFAEGHFDKLYATSRHRIPVGTDMYD
jgi:phage minor structural protein